MPNDLETLIRDYVTKFDQSNKVVNIHENKNEYLFTNNFSEPITNTAINKYLAKIRLRLRHNR